MESKKISLKPLSKRGGIIARNYESHHPNYKRKFIKKIAYSMVKEA